MKAIIFKPIYQERVWGGRNLEYKLGRSLPEDKTIGESWEIVDRPEAQSVAEGGKSIREFLKADPEAIMGRNWPAERPFPILVKWLDCQEKLSLQVHPPAKIASELGSEPKSEIWYVASAEPHATLMAGLKKGVRKDDFKQALKENALEPLVHTFHVKAGESIFIPSGRLHAIGGGNLILEIQQNSDTTYRVYDWGRVGLNGKPRQLHIEESIRSIDFNDFEPETTGPSETSQLLAESDVFNLRKEVLNAGETLSFSGGSPVIISMLNGALMDEDGSSFDRGDNALLPANSSFTFTAATATKCLVTSDFAKHP